MQCQSLLHNQCLGQHTSWHECVLFFNSNLVLYQVLSANAQSHHLDKALGAGAGTQASGALPNQRHTCLPFKAHGSIPAVAARNNIAIHMYCTHTPPPWVSQAVHNRGSCNPVRQTRSRWPDESQPVLDLVATEGIQQVVEPGARYGVDCIACLAG
jgi:hypothetical protein